MLRRVTLGSFFFVVGLGFVACGGKVDSSGPGGVVVLADSGVRPPLDAGGHPTDAGLMVIDAPISVLDSAASPPDVSFFDSGELDVTFPDDVGPGPDATTSCSANTPFSPTPWAPPTPLHQGACTAAEITTISNALEGGGSTTFSSGNAKCDACLLTDEMAAAHGPLITAMMGGMTVPVELNFGGCIADFDGMKTSSGCGATLNWQNDCAQDECAMCSDFDNPSPNGPSAQCEEQVFEAGQVCSKFQPSPACQAEETEDGGISACVSFSTLNQFFTLWCGT